jgi:nucleotide-binding universal stress UspA family protein
MKKILIALDYDPSATKVAENGISLAKSMNAESILCHVIKDPVLYSASEQAPILGFSGHLYTVPEKFDNIDELKKIAMQFLEKIKHQYGDDGIQTIVVEGDEAESILKTAVQENASVIVMGVHSQNWLENKIMGNVTEKVIHHASIPLFIIPTKREI